jgi:hypothetical protein
MYVLLLITATTINTVTVQRLGTFDDLQSCQTAAVEQLAITRVLQKSPKMQFRCERKQDN